MYAVAMGTSEWEAFVPRSHMLHLLTLGTPFVCCFYYGVPALALSSSFLSSCCPACSMSRRGDFFLPTHQSHNYCLLVPSADVILICPCGRLAFFVGFIWDRLPCACLPAPPCLIRLAPLPGTLPMMSSSHRLAHRLALRALIAPRPVIRHDRRGGVLASPYDAFHVRTP